MEPVAALMNVSPYLAGDNSDWVPVDERVIGRLTNSTSTPPLSCEVRIPIRMDGGRVDVDNDGEADAGVQIHALSIGSNLTGGSYLELIDQAAYRSVLRDPATGAFREGTLLLHAADDAQSFPSGAGEGGIYFTGDDPVAGLRTGYTLAKRGRDDLVTFDQSRVARMDTLGEAAQASPDFSGQGILKRYTSSTASLPRI